MPNLKNKVVTYMTLSADASTCNNPSQVYAKKSDANSRYLVVRIVDANGSIDVQGNAQLNATKPDGTHVYVGGDTNDDGTVTILLKSSVLALDGKVSCDITVFDKEDNETVILTTSTFFILVADSNYKADALESTNEFSMSAEMIAQVAEDRRVAEQAREEAKKYLTNIENIVSQGALSNALKGSSIGEVVRIDDISPIGHEMAVRVSGKNLFNNDTSKIEQVTYTGQTATGQRFGYTLHLPAGTYTAHAKAIDESTKEGYIYGVINTKYRVYKRSVNLVAQASCPIITFNIDEGDVLYIYAGINYAGIEYARNDFAKWDIQIEIGTTATDHVPYVEPSAVKVRKCGKNLLPYSYYTKSNTTQGVTYTVNQDGTIGVSGTATGQSNFYIADNDSFSLPAGSYRVSIGDSLSTSGVLTLWLYNTANKKSVAMISSEKRSTSFTLNAKTNFSIYTVFANGDISGIIEPQIEVGKVKTNYEAPIKPTEYTPNEDGTVDGVTPLYPTTTLMTDTAGAVLDVTYTRDANKVVNELTSRLAALESAVLN